MDLAKTGYCRGGGTWGAIAPPIFFEIGRILAFSYPNIFRSNVGASRKNSLAPPIFYTFHHP